MPCIYKRGLSLPAVNAGMFYCRKAVTENNFCCKDNGGGFSSPPPFPFQGLVWYFLCEVNLLAYIIKGSDLSVRQRAALLPAFLLLCELGIGSDLSVRQRAAPLPGFFEPLRGKGGFATCGSRPRGSAPWNPASL